MTATHQGRTELADLSSAPSSLRRLQLELINLCNFRCPLCRTLLRDNVVRRRMSCEEMAVVVDPVREQLEVVTLYGTRGEPFLHPELEPCIAWLERKTSAIVEVSTNGSLVTEERAARVLDAGLDRIIFAIDGLSAQSYASYRVGGSLDLVLDNLATLCALKQRGGYATQIIFQLIPMSTNEAEIAALPALAARLGVDDAWIKVSASVTRDRRLRPSARYHGAPADGFDACPFGSDKLYVDPNGDCFPCCYAEGVAAMSLGNALTTSLTEIWEHALARRIRSSFAGGAAHHPFCIERCSNRPRKRKLKLLSRRPMCAT